MSTASPNQAATPGDRSRAFTAAGVFAAIITAITTPLGIFNWLPAVGPLLERGGPVRWIAILVIGFSLWVLLFVLVRSLIASQERAATIRLQLKLAEPDGRRAVLEDGIWLGNTVLDRRVSVLRTAPDSAVTELATRSELDHAHVEVAYVPAQALVWALPALGFLGTAAEMSRAVGGLGDSVGAATDYAGLRNALVSDVIPPLADAFGVTLFALGAGVLCHILLTWNVAREQRVLLSVEEVMLRLVGPHPASAVPATSLGRELDALTEELRTTRMRMVAAAQQIATSTEQMAGSMQQVAQMDLSQLANLSYLTPLLQSIDQRLGQIQNAQSSDLIITRRRSILGEDLS